MTFFRTPELEIEFRKKLLDLFWTTFQEQQKGKDRQEGLDTPQMKNQIHEIFEQLLSSSGAKGSTPEYPHGLHQIIEFFYHHSCKNPKIPFETHISSLFSNKVTFFKSIVAHYSCPAFLAAALSTPNPVEDIKNKMSFQYKEKNIINQLQKSFTNSGFRDRDRGRDRDRRQVLIERPHAVLLKRLDTIATWICPSQLSKCAAATFFKNRLTISANMEREGGEEDLERIILARVNILKTWCEQALVKKLSGSPKAMRIKSIVEEIITETESQKGSEGGRSFDVPESYYHNPSLYLREQLAKVVDTFCFDSDYASLRKGFLEETPRFLFPCVKTMEELLSAEEFKKYLALRRPRGVHAEQVLFLWGEVGGVRETSHVVGISKCCCGDCYRLASKHQYVVSGNHTTLYPSVIDLFSLTQRGYDTAPHLITALPFEQEGYITPREGAAQFAQTLRSGDPSSSVLKLCPIGEFYRFFASSPPPLDTLNSSLGPSTDETESASSSPSSLGKGGKKEPPEANVFRRPTPPTPLL